MNKILYLSNPGTSVLPGDDPAKTDHINFMGYAPGLFRYAFRKAIDSALQSYRSETGNSYRCYYPSTCYDDRYMDIWKMNHIDGFPDAISSMGFCDLFRKEFVERFVNKGYFKNAWEGPVNRCFEEAGLIDPDGWYTIYSVMPFLICVDKTKIGSLPLPKSWRDLLNPHYRQKIILPGTEDTVSILLLYYYKEFGREGIEKLSTNMKMTLQSAEMARLAGSSRSPAPIYVISWFFALACPRPSSTIIIWPEDGAIVNPLYMLIKREKTKESSPVIDCILGPDLGRKIAQSCFPVINPQVDNMLPEGASFKWIGWDYIKSHNIIDTREYAQSLFSSTWKRKV